MYKVHEEARNKYESSDLYQHTYYVQLAVPYVLLSFPNLESSIFEFGAASCPEYKPLDIVFVQRD